MDELSVESRMDPEKSMVVERAGFLERFLPLDWMVLAYTVWVALLVVLAGPNVPHRGAILALHLLAVTAIVLVPSRGAAWERARLSDGRWARNARGGLRFFRYSYPLLLVVFFFEEVQHTVNAFSPDAPHWFEAYLYAADRLVFGELPAVLLNPFVGFVQDEILHGFYFSYYFVVVGGVVIAWLSGSRERPGPGFQATLTAGIAGFLLCFVWFPFLPARGPWENPELMAMMTPFEGIVFTPLIEKIIEQGAVSGGCFPSSHVGGSWGVVLGLWPYHRKAALVLLFFTLGMSFSCVYTRYHHGVDVPAGMLAGILGAMLAHRLARRGAKSERTKAIDFARP